MNRLCLLTASLSFTVAGAAGAADAPLALVQTIQLKGVAGKLDHLEVDAKGQRLFIANKPNNTLDVVDLKTGTLVKQVAGQGKVSGVAYAADLDLIYAGNGAGTCNAFSGKDYAPAFSAKCPKADNVHYDAASKSVFVGQDDLMTVLDAATGAVKSSIQLPGAVHGFQIDARAGKLYGVLTKPSVVGVVDLADLKVSAQWKLTLSDAGSPCALDEANGVLFVGCPKKPMVVAFDVKTGAELGAVAIPAGVDDVHYDAERKRLYASCAAGSIAVVEKSAAGYAVTAKVETPKDSRTCAFAAGKLYLGVPRQEGQDGPEVRVYQAK